MMASGPAALGTQQIVPLSLRKFSRDAEIEADLLGIEYQYATGYDPEAFVEALKKLSGIANRSTVKVSGKTSLHDQIARAFANYPPTEDRIQRLQAAISMALAGPFAEINILVPDPPTETGDITQLNASGSDAFGNPVPLPPLTWASADLAVATVTPGGLLAALNPGSARISATGEAITGSLTLTVNAGTTFTLGTVETVFTYNTDNCYYLDVPDVPARAVRLADGTLMLVAGNDPQNYAMMLNDFSSCSRTTRSA